MQPPEAVRGGARVRAHASTGSAVSALSYLDLRFDDGRIERWIGPGLDSPGSGMAPGQSLVALGAEVFEDQAECLLEEIAMDWPDVLPDALDGIPVETVVEWLHES